MFRGFGSGFGFVLIDSGVSGGTLVTFPNSASLTNTMSSSTGGSLRKCGNPNHASVITSACRPTDRVAPSLMKAHPPPARLLVGTGAIGTVISAGKASISLARVAKSVRNAITWIPALRISPATTAIAP